MPHKIIIDNDFLRAYDTRMPHELGRRMRIYRAAHNLNQTELGRKIGATCDCISRVERGVGSLTEKQAKKLAALFAQSALENFVKAS